MKRQQSPDRNTNERLECETLVLQHKTSPQVQQSRQTMGQREGVHKAAQICRRSKKQEKTVIKKGTSVSEVA